jgi:hypothetical protein
MAQDCPDLSGRFRCQGGYEIRVETLFGPDGPLYRFQGPVEGSTELWADGEPHPIRSKIGSGLIRGTCRDGRLIADYVVEGKRGEERLRDTMYIERKALVRVRQSGGRVNPGSGRLEFLHAGAFVCRPVF